MPLVSRKQYDPPKPNGEACAGAAEDTGEGGFATDCFCYRVQVLCNFHDATKCLCRLMVRGQ